MEVVLAQLDAVRRRGPEALPALRATFAAASATLQVLQNLQQNTASAPCTDSTRTSTNGGSSRLSQPC